MAHTDHDSKLPTLHHLNDSQSQRILWLLEELDVEYNLELYSRNLKTLRAPPSLAAVSPLGKSPVLVSSDGRVIIESSAIASFILNTYDTKDRFEKGDAIRDEIITSFVGTSLGVPATFELLLDLGHKFSPWPVKWLVSLIWKGVHDSFTGKEMRTGLQWLEGELGDEKWFGGAKLSKADVMASWSIDLIAFRDWIKLEKEFPKLWEWRQRVHSRPAWTKSIAKGNGYDLQKW